MLIGKVLNLDYGMTAIETLLSWTIMGKISCQENDHQDAANTHTQIRPVFAASAAAEGDLSFNQ